MQWLLLGVLGIIWVAFLIPVGRRRSDSRSVEDFERRMELLANAEVHGTTGRWIVTPRKGVRFLGPRERQQARARARRRRVFVFLIEARCRHCVSHGSYRPHSAGFCFCMCGRCS